MKFDRDCYPFAAALAALSLGVALAAPRAAAIPLLMLAFTLWFFRDPEREAPPGTDLLLSPADGRVLAAGPKRVSIFMNVFDVHVCRTPMAGRVVSVERSPGRFLSAFKDAASEHNERTTVVVEGPAGTVRFTLVAGLVARRIVCRVRPGQVLEAGDRVGLIRFGSRVDVDLPGGTAVAVKAGERVASGMTVLGRIGPGRRPG